MGLRITRKIGERICIDDNIIVNVLSIGDSQVSLDIEAPTNVAVDREELRLKKLLGHVETKDVKEAKTLSHQSISDHVSEVIELHLVNRNERESVRLMKLLPEMKLLPDDFIAALISGMTENNTCSVN